MSVPVRLDPHQQARVKRETLVSYQRAARDFADWLSAVGWHPDSAESWDDALVEYKNVVEIQKAKFAHTVSAVEFFFARFRGHWTL